MAVANDLKLPDLPPCASIGWPEIMRSNMSELVQVAVQPSKAAAARSPKPRVAVFWLQGVTLVWMLVEFGVSAYAAVTAHSPAMLAFGSDSLVELLSATVVLLQWVPSLSISERKAGRVAGALLFALAFVVAAIAVASLALRLRPATSYAGIAITVAALIAMPFLAFLKRREAHRSKNAALAADAVQSAACAYLALIALAGLVINAAFHVAWFDSFAALLAVPILIKEGWSAWKGRGCGCC
jgi:divalent metal cation (Fe/Co/Zn/Cd) transporter